MRYNFINKADLVAFLEQKAEETKRNIIIKKNDEVWQRCEKYMYLHFANIVKNSMRYNFINKADLVAFLEQKAEETKRNIIIKKNDEVWQRCEKYMYLHFANIVKNSNITTTVE